METADDIKRKRGKQKAEECLLLHLFSSSLPG